MQKIIPHLWFDKEAKEAAEFYVNAFGGDSAVIGTEEIKDTPSGDAEIVSFKLLGYELMAISAGPLFKINPSVSFFVNFDPSNRPNAKEDLDKLWAKLADGGQPLMPLAKYPFSEWYGWIQDKFGVSWQLMLSNPEGEARPSIVPSLLFTKDVSGKAEEAMNFYLSVFKDSKPGIISRYGKDQSPNIEGTVAYEDFNLGGVWVAAMDSALEHNFTFNEAVSFIIDCADQAEVDYFWEKLTAGGSEQPCGWLKDKYGFSWQVVPTAMRDFLSRPDEEGKKRATAAMLKMNKLDIAALERAYSGSE